ncbi:hypothetical protein GY45DRAFT_1243251 [Cubamyces sp. BRFM 1775]|nr:hypothetical protein GY45DRAFT_1243251 [Cubamyces sp. BRFM 1775]
MPPSLPTSTRPFSSALSLPIAEQEPVSCHPPVSTFKVCYPGCGAGAAICDPLATAQVASPTYRQYQSEVSDPEAQNLYAPFASETDWELARWAKLRGAGSTAFTDLLAINGLAQKLSLSYKDSRTLNAIIDKLPSGRPAFQRHEIDVAGQMFEVYFRDVVACIRSLFGDPEFAPLLLLVPERHYTDESRSVRVYFDMNTGKWWWATQAELEKQRPGATVVPIIISSDKTQLTLIGNKSAYPVYMTLGNLPKDVRCKPSRRGQILLAYLPTTRLLHITNKASRRRTLANLFHACMGRVLEPLATLGVSGMYLASGDGVVRRGHPIVATFVGDYPEQLLVTGGKNGECPKCDVPRNEVGELSNAHRPFRDLGKVLDALAAIDEGPLAFTRACRDAGIKPLYHPFWEALPYTNIFAAITPDVLHQLYQGVLKHLVAWVQTAYGSEELDARCARLPPNHSLRAFTKGISSLSRVTGKEHQDIGRILLGLIVGLPLPGGASSTRLVRATRALLDFLYLAQLPTHTSRTLRRLDKALQDFHANKQVFVDLNIREHFKLPKLHSLEHYRRSIELFGTTDNYDTQYSERLHIDLAKDAYRATNCKDEFAQMTKWLERKEKVQRHEKYIQWRLASRSLSSHPQPAVVDKPSTHVTMTRHPSVKAVSWHDASTKYGAPYIRDALTRYVVSLKHPNLSDAQVELACGAVFFNFRAMPVFHKIRFNLRNNHTLGVTTSNTSDTAHIRPSRRGKHGGDVPARFDTVLVRVPPGTIPHRFRIAQIRMIFTLPQKAMPDLFPTLAAADRPRHLAYVEWFSPTRTGSNPHPDHGMYKIARSTQGGARLASVISVEDIERTCHLFPDFGPVAPRHWTTSNVLEECDVFWLNPFVDRETYMLIS